VRALAPRLRALYAQKRSVMEQAIRTHIGDRLAWASPRGGFFVWATLPSGYSDNALLDSALAHGVIFVSGSAFFVDGSGHDTIRLSFSAPSLDRIEEGIRRLAAAMNVQRPLGVR
jgi:2-aminoadipate transaminase